MGDRNDVVGGQLAKSGLYRPPLFALRDRVESAVALVPKVSEKRKETGVALLSGQSMDCLYVRVEEEEVASPIDSDSFR